MACPEKSDLIEAYADGELDLGSSLEIERHLADCKDCAAVLEGHRALRSALGTASLYHDAPAQLSSRVRAAVRKQEKVFAASPFFGWRWLAVAAPVISLVILGWSLVTVSRMPSSEDLLNQEIVSAHVRSLMAAHLTDFPSSDQHTVKPAFNGRIDFSPEVKDLASEGFALIGGRLDYLDRRPVAALIYQRRKHLINLFIYPAEDGAGERAVETSLRGYNLIRWTRAGMRYAAVSDLNLVELRSFQQALQE
ncbi:MAG TPA: anti-sigma factor [Candidatus Polarisedimenticolia bacterium]|nr:anti-sigma factor [Candidatus Polarisedimenticolia bacterium]